MTGLFYKLPQDVTADKKLSSTSKILLAVIKDRIGDNGTCWPSIRRLAQDVGCNPDTISKAILQLERYGYMAVDRPGIKKVNRYSLPKSVPKNGADDKDDLSQKTDRTAPENRTDLEGESVPKNGHTVPEIGTNLSQKPVTNQTKTNNQTKIRSDEMFDAFWKAYPKKVAKAKARMVWGKLNIDDKLFSQVMAALKLQRQSDQWAKDGGQYIPHPTTWLNGQRWEDEIDLGDDGPRVMVSADLGDMSAERQEEIRREAWGGQA